MDDAQAFRELLVEGLQGFGWTATVDDIPDVDSVQTVMDRIMAWWNPLDSVTRDILGSVDLSDPLWNNNFLTEWPLFYTLIQGNAYGSFKDTFIDINRCVQHAKDGAADRAAQHMDTTVEDVDPESVSR